MAQLILDGTKRYSYADYLKWFDDKRRELIDGFVHLMTPAPSRLHQRVSIKLANQFENYLADKGCEVYQAPFDVRLPKPALNQKDEQIHTVVQPDICVVCDLDKLDDRGCLGAPDLIVEILSPSSTTHDTQTKFALYEAAGVKEYWVAYPHDQVVNVFLLAQGKYQFAGIFTADQQVGVSLFNGLLIDLSRVFQA